MSTAGQILQSEWLSPGQLATRFDLSASTLKRWRVDGKGPKHIKVGRNVFYVASDVEEWLQSRREVSSGNQKTERNISLSVQVAGQRVRGRHRFGRKALKSESGSGLRAV